MTKNILITGGAGYIGSHVAEELIKNKRKVFIIDNLSSGYKKLINKKSIFFCRDLSNEKKIRSILIKNKINSVVHLAGSLVISEGEKKPIFYYRNNVITTKKLLSACIQTSVKNIIFSSTAAVYKDSKKKVTENSQLKPKSVYGKTKLKSEKLIIKFCRTYKLNFAILRYFNVVGSSPSGKIGLINKNDNLFKNFSYQACKKKSIFKIYGSNYMTTDGTCIRDFIHVSDLAKIHFKVLERIDKSHQSKILNCGYGKGFSVKQVLNEFKKYSSKNIKILELPKRKGDLAKMITDNKRLKKFIKWRPKFNSLKAMVKSSISWEKKQ